MDDQAYINLVGVSITRRALLKLNPKYSPKEIMLYARACVASIADRGDLDLDASDCLSTIASEVSNSLTKTFGETYTVTFRDETGDTTDDVDTDLCLSIDTDSIYCSTTQ